MALYVGDGDIEPLTEVRRALTQDRAGQPQGPLQPGSGTGRGLAADVDPYLLPSGMQLVGHPERPHGEGDDIVAAARDGVGVDEAEVAGDQEPHGRGGQLDLRRGIGGGGAAHPGGISGFFGTAGGGHQAGADPGGQLVVAHLPRRPGGGSRLAGRPIAGRPIGGLSDRPGGGSGDGFGGGCIGGFSGGSIGERGGGCGGGCGGGSGVLMLMPVLVREHHPHNMPAHPGSTARTPSHVEPPDRQTRARPTHEVTVHSPVGVGTQLRRRLLPGPLDQPAIGERGERVRGEPEQIRSHRPTCSATKDASSPGVIAPTYAPASARRCPSSRS